MQDRLWFLQTANTSALSLSRILLKIKNMKKNQKIVTFVVIIVLALVILLAAVFFLRGQEQEEDFVLTPGQQAQLGDFVLTPEQQTELEEFVDANPYLQEDLAMETKKIKVEIATDEELNEIGIVPKTPDGRGFRLQVIERDQSGKIISYKVIYDDEDIAEEITVPEVGYFTNGGVIPFAE